jgi:hypothetical protein
VKREKERRVQCSEGRQPRWHLAVLQGPQHRWRPPVHRDTRRLPRLHPKAPTEVAPYSSPRTSDTLKPYSQVQKWNMFFKQFKIKKAPPFLPLQSPNLVPKCAHNGWNWPIFIRVPGVGSPQFLASKASSRYVMSNKKEQGVRTATKVSCN